MTFEAAAALLVNYGTTYHALVQRAQLKSGETLLVLGAAGGVGLSAVEIGKALGARVIAAASTNEKLALARAAGADEVINYSSGPLKQQVMALTQDKGVDVVYDPVGGDFSEQAVRSMAWNGRFLVIGFAAGKIPAIPLNLPLLKGCSLVGVFWGTHTRREPEVHQANMRALFALHAAGKIRPQVTKLAGIERVSEAMEILNSRRSTGKLVISVQ